LSTFPFALRNCSVNWSCQSINF